MERAQKTVKSFVRAQDGLREALPQKTEVLVLNMPQHHQEASLEGCIRAHCDAEEIHDANTRITQWRELTGFGKTVGFQLSRFKQNSEGLAEKDGRDVACPAILAIGGSLFSLQGFVAHEGDTITAGHFVSYLALGSGGAWQTAALPWVQLNDSQVSRLTAEQAAQKLKQAYVLVYQRLL